MSECSGKDTKGKKRNQKKIKTRRARSRIVSFGRLQVQLVSSIMAAYSVRAGYASAMSKWELLLYHEENTTKKNNIVENHWIFTSSANSTVG